MGWFRADPIGIVEIEASYLRFLRPTAKGWESRAVPVAEGEVLEALRREAPAFFGAVRRLAFVLAIEAGSKLMPFPAGLPDAEILGHLALKREDYFGLRDELRFTLRPCATEGGHRELLVSYAKQAFIDRLQSVCGQLGCQLERLVTPLEAMIAAWRRERGRQDGGVACLLSLGYSAVNMAFIKNGMVTGVRTAITGSLKDLEVRLLRTLRLQRAELVEYLVGARADPDPNVLQVIRQSQQEFLTRVTPLIAAMRGRGGAAEKISIYLLSPYLEIAGIRELLEETFSVPVVPLTGLSPGENAADPALAASGWLLGALDAGCAGVSLVRPPWSFLQFRVTPRLALGFSLLFLLAPWGFLRLNLAAVRDRVEALRSRSGAVREILGQMRANEERKRELVAVGEVLETELARRVVAADLVAEVVRAMAGEMRLDRVEVAGGRSLQVAGIAVDAGTVLRFFDSLRSRPRFTAAKLGFPGEGPGAVGVPFTLTVELTR